MSAVADETVDAKRARRRAEMHKSLDLAQAIWSLISDRSSKAVKVEGIGILSIERDEILPIIREHFTAPLNDLRMTRLAESLITVITNEGLDSCSMWSFAHLLDHILWDDLEKLRE